MLHEEQQQYLAKVSSFYLPPKTATLLAREMQLNNPNISDDERAHSLLPWGDTYVVKYYHEDTNHKTYPNDIIKGYTREKGLPFSQIDQNPVERSAMNQNFSMLERLLDEEIKQASFEIHDYNDAYFWKSDGARISKKHQAHRFAKCDNGFIGVAYYTPHAYNGLDALEMCSFILYALSYLNPQDSMLSRGASRLATISKDGVCIISYHNKIEDLDSLVDKSIEHERIKLMDSKSIVYMRK